MIPTKALLNCAARWPLHGRWVVRPNIYPDVKINVFAGPYLCDDFLLNGSGMIFQQPYNPLDVVRPE